MKRASNQVSLANLVRQTLTKKVVDEYSDCF
jgi:hypothetical protein